MSMMQESLEILERAIYQIKALLKQRDHLIFEEVKLEVLDKLRMI